MTQIIGGHNLGLFDGSFTVLNRNDPTGAGTIGHGVRSYANISNGNLILQERDVYLPSFGDDLEFVRTCGRDETVELAKSLIRFRTVSADETGDFAPQLAGMSKFLAGWAKSHGFSFHAIGSNDVFELGWGKGADPKLALVFHGDVVPAPKGCSPAYSR